METSGGILKHHCELGVAFDNFFTNFTRLLYKDDKIKFKGLLQNLQETFSIGSKEPLINAYEISCVECKDSGLQGVTLSSKLPVTSKFSDLYKTVVNDCVVSTKYILNFILNPILVIK